MGSNWPQVSLKDANVVLIDCVHKTPPKAEAGLPYLAIPQMKTGSIDLDGARLVSRADFVEWTRKANPELDDVVLSRRCNPGVTAAVPPGMQFALGQNLVLLRADGNQVHKPFLKWLVRSPEWWEQVGKFINVGAVFDSLRCRDVPKFQLPLPPLPEQRRIAAVLGALDDKIELNRKMNRTLEEMAQAIFKSWFIDFDGVPDSEMVDSELGRIPRGWEVARLRDSCTKIGSGSTPRGGKKVYVNEGPRLIRSQNVYDFHFEWAGIVCLTDDDAYRLRGVAVEPGDVLLNITGDSILRTCVVDATALPARVNQHVAIIRPRPPIPPEIVHLHLVQARMKSRLLGYSAGATRKAITKGHLESIELPLPPIENLVEMGARLRPLYARRAANMTASRTLAALRDTLLPKLISGEIRVPAAEEAVEAVL